MRQAALILLGMLLLAADAAAITGNQWKQNPPAVRQAYVMAVLDTWKMTEDLRIMGNKSSTVKEFPDPPSFITDIVNCMAGKMTYEQIVAIVEKYMQNNPAEWHYEMPSVVWAAAEEACAPSPPTTKTPPPKKGRK